MDESHWRKLFLSYFIRDTNSAKIKISLSYSLKTKLSIQNLVKTKSLKNRQESHIFVQKNTKLIFGFFELSNIMLAKAKI